MNFTIQETPTEIKPCIQQVQKQIFVDDNGEYAIPKDLIITDFPESIINSFLDFLNEFNDSMKSSILQSIKEGSLTVICTEDE